MQTFVDPGTDFRCMSFAMQSSSRLFFFLLCPSTWQDGKDVQNEKLRIFFY